MPCKHKTHCHVWNTSGELTIERCEKTCYFCAKTFKHAWFLRRHVSSVHCKQYQGLKVEGGWTGSPKGNRRPGSPEKRKKRHSRKQSNFSTSSFASTETSGGSSTSNFTGFEAMPGEVMKSIEAFGEPYASAPAVFPAGAVEQADMDAMIAQMFPVQSGYTATDGSKAIPSSEHTVVPETNFDVFDPDFTFDSTDFFAHPLSFSSTSSFTSTWVTSQNARVNGVEISSSPPVIEHERKAQQFTDGLNNIVADLTAKEQLTEQEVLYILETFTDTYKLGMKMPMEW